MAWPRTVCIIEARMASTRLPGKVLRPILGRPMLALMIERLERCATLDGIVVATTIAGADDQVAALARDLGVGAHRGSDEDVLDRVVGAARAFDAEVIVETTGDCPLIDPALLDKVVADFRIGGADFVSNTLDYTTPRGTDVRVFRADALAEINRTSTDPADHEHVSLHFWEHPEKYRLRNVATGLGAEAPTRRLTVDTPDDFAAISSIFEALYPVNPAFTLSDVLDLLNGRPDITALNAMVRQKSVRPPEAG